MRVLIYCQHVLGIGHLARTVEIARALEGEQVTLVLGGPPVNIPLPPHVRRVQLPPLQMDAGFNTLSTLDPALSVSEVREQRAALLLQIAADVRPDVLLVELFPFGRNMFSFELLPLLTRIREGTLPSCRVVCSLRDILVEKQDRQKYEQRVLDRLNSYFDALLVHSDPRVIDLDATFSRVGDIAVPLVYTGYISRRSDPARGVRLRRCLTGTAGATLVVASAGSGSVGYPLLSAAMQAFPHLDSPVRMAVFSGPHLDGALFAALAGHRMPGLWLRRFSNRFPLWLQAADISLSMGGYNTTMDVLASSTPALIFPFGQNREQEMRCRRLQQLGLLESLAEKDLAPRILAGKIMAMAGRQRQQTGIDLDGARFTAAWLKDFAREIRDA